MRHMELALQTVMPDSKEPMALHYWDETSKESIQEGIPELLTKKSITIKGVTYDPNPLYQYKYQADIANEESSHHRKKGDPTVRYPFSGHHGDGANKHNR